MMWGPKRKPPSVRTCCEKHTKPQRTCQVPLRKDIKASFLGDLPCLLSRYFDQIVEVLQSLKAINDVTWCSPRFLTYRMPMLSPVDHNVLSQFWGISSVCAQIYEPYAWHGMSSAFRFNSTCSLRLFAPARYWLVSARMLSSWCFSFFHVKEVVTLLHEKWETRTCYVCRQAPTFQPQCLGSILDLGLSIDIAMNGNQIFMGLFLWRISKSSKIQPIFVLKPMVLDMPRL